MIGAALISWLFEPVWSLIGVVRSLSFGVVVICGVFVTASAFRWSSTFGQSRESTQGPESDKIDPSVYRKWYGIRSLAFFICAPLAGWVMYLLLIALSRIWRELAAGRYTIGVVDQYWLLPATLLGIALGAIMVNVTMKILFAGQSSRLEAEYTARIGASARRSEIPIFGFGGVLCFLLIFGGWNNHVRFEDSGIGIQRFYRLGEDFHSYTEVTSITRITRQIVKKDVTDLTVVYEIVFSEGTLWRSDVIGLAGEEADLYSNAISYAAERSRVRVQEKEIAISP